MILLDTGKVNAPPDRALIIGVSGQDGSYLSELLLRKGYEVHGTGRETQTQNYSKLESLGLRDKITTHKVDPGVYDEVANVIETVKPGEIFHLAGQSSVSRSFKEPFETHQSIVESTLNILEFMRLHSRRTKLFFASSSECFGSTSVASDVGDPFVLQSPYAVSKASGHWLVSSYRNNYGLYACSGILFSHESPLRGVDFVSRKIVSAAVQIAKGELAKLQLGDLSVRRDWGWAPEYVEAMWQMLQMDEPEDFVIGTGETNSLENFVEIVFSTVGLDWRDFVETNPSLCRANELRQSMACTKTTTQKLGWTAGMKMKQVIKKLVEHEQSRTK